uniref:phage scaffolding protein n=1 Tax=Ndongobacter massiliensis TaxID=1871025 RepID=UPI0009304B75|nr:phage scaffolding protein [Ndongobacter massiliensis]
MDRKKLSEFGITEEAAEKVMAEYGKDVQGLKAQVQTMTAENENLKAQIKERDKDLSDLKEKAEAGSKEALASLQEKYDADAKKWEADLQKTRMQSAVDLGLTKAKARNLVATKALLKMDDLKLSDDGSLQGFSEQLQKIQEENPYLFEETEPQQNSEEKKPQFSKAGNASVGETTHADKLAEALGLTTKE